jgi:hypothetical protein
MEVPFDIIWTEQFQISWGKLSYEMRGMEQLAEIDDKIDAAIAKLEKGGPDMIEPYHPGSSEFSYRVDDTYLLVVRWRTDCDGEGRHLFHHLDLWGVERSPLGKKI